MVLLYSFKLKKNVILILLHFGISLHFQALQSQSSEPEPIMGWEKFKEELIANNPEVDSQLNRVGLVMARYEATISKKGSLESLKLIADAQLNGLCTPFLGLALRETAWKAGTRKGNSREMTFSFVLNLTRHSQKLDSTSQYWANERDSAIKRMADSLTLGTGRRYFHSPARDIEAYYLGGDQAFIEHVQKHFQYPPRCRESGINGSAIVQFQVNHYGEVSGFTFIDSTKACPEFNKEVIRVISISAPWVPPVYNGYYISRFRRIPISIIIE